MRTGKRRIAHLMHRLIVGAILFYLVAPALVVIPMSFLGESMKRLTEAEVSLDAYRRFLTQPGWITATVFSLEMSVLVMVLSLLIGASTAYGLVNASAKLGQILSVLAILPVLAPTIVFALAIYWLLAQLDLLGTMAGFVLANLVLALPYAIITVRSALESFDRSLVKAASVLGAKPPRIVVRVVIPILMPALAAAALFSFLIAFDEVVVAQFISGPHAVPLSKTMWDGILFRWDPAISAISTLQITITIAVLVVVGLLRRRSPLGAFDV
jgi:ABC-type spermidine/putrescine transport system permease subunit II